MMACCGYYSSYALTTEGLVYKWGKLIKNLQEKNDKYSDLGEIIETNRPKLMDFPINITN